MKLLFFRKPENSRSSTQFLSEKIEKLLDAARLLFTQSESLKRLVAVEKSAVQKSSSAAYEISSMVSTTADAANELSRMAVESNRAVSSSAEALRVLTGLVEEVDSSSKELQEKVRLGLSEIGSVTNTMSEIREKAKMINDVVFQTKLLSFNASVEAARAGDHGRGFAVVAEEMGKLAKTSGQAAHEIEEILVTSVERTRVQIEEVTKNLETVAKSTVEAISQVSAKSREISTGFSRLEGFSKTTESKAQEISHATNEQKLGVQEISKALQELEASSVELDNMALNSNKNSAELASEVEDVAKRFSDLASQLGFRLVKVEKPFDFDAAIRAHIDWKMKLSNYLEKPDGSLDHAKVCMDNACMLGKWIYGEGQKFREADTVLFEDMRRSHASFHQTAGKIIELINARRTAEAGSLLSASGPYLEVSRKTVELIQEMKRAVDKSPSRNAA
jgi:methyl-accepting chemotaxis protein